MVLLDRHTRAQKVRAAPRGRNGRRSLPYLIAALAGAVLLVGLGAPILHHRSVYWSQVNVVFLAPRSASYPNSLATPTSSAIIMAGVVAEIADGGRGGSQVVSDSVNLVDEGIVHGYQVRLPNDGGQWAINFDVPTLDVQAVGTSPAEVQATMARGLREIDRITWTLQHDAGAASVNMITTQQSPRVVPVYEATSSRVRALGALSLLGAAWCAGIAALVRRSRRDSVMPPDPAGNPFGPR